MADILIRCAFALGILTVLFYFFSVPLEGIFHFKLQYLSERIIYGFFAYFFVFELAALPLIFLKQPFSLLTRVWTAAMLIVVIISLLFIFVKKCGRIILDPQGKPFFSVICILLAAGFVAALMILSVCEKYIGWDPSYYLGTMNTTLLTDTMYQYDGSDGTLEKTINLRYALSAFYMQFTVLCKLLSIPVRPMAWFVMRPLCVMLSGIGVYNIGRTVSGGRTYLSAQLVLIWSVISLFWSGLHTTAYFMLVRGYEAKGYCANVVIPMVLCSCIALLGLRARDEKEQWKRLALVCWASVPVSMSSMAIVPSAVLILMLVLMLVDDKRLSNIIRAFVCVLPNLLIIGVYLLSKI